MGSMPTITAEIRRDESAALRWGVNFMTLGAVAFIGYAVIFFVLNFTDGFLELGIGSDQVASGKDEIKAFDTTSTTTRPLPLHQPPPYRRLRLHCRHRSCRRRALLVRRPPPLHVGVGRGRGRTGSRTRGRAPGALPVGLRHDWTPRPDLSRHCGVRRRGALGAQRYARERDEQLGWRESCDRRRQAEVAHHGIEL